MKIDDLQLLFDYHYWALDHLLNHLRELPAAKLTTNSPHLYHKTAQQTVLHILDVDWSWRLRCQGKPGGQYLWEVEDLPDLPAMHTFLHQEQETTNHYLASLSEADLTAKVQYAEGKEGVARWQILSHIINHGTEHRTEIGHFLTEWGKSPGELGLFRYLVAVRNA